MTTPEFREILDDYVSSSRELLERAEETLLAVESAEGAFTPEDLASLKRLFHTLKGNSAMMGFDAVANAAHVMEDALAASDAGEATADEEVVSLLLTAIGKLSVAFRSGEVPETAPPEWSEALADLSRLASEAGPAPAARSTREARAGAAGALTADDAGSGTLGARSRSLRVSHASLERLLELSGEMHILLAGVAERVRRLAARSPSEEAEAASESLELLLRTFGLLEREVFATRLVPVGTVLSRFRRLVRDLALELGKEVDFVAQGGETTFDKSVVDELGEPLLHLVRNALDHGLEQPADREARQASPRDPHARRAAGVQSCRGGHPRRRRGHRPRPRPPPRRRDGNTDRGHGRSRSPGARLPPRLLDSKGGQCPFRPRGRARRRQGFRRKARGIGARALRGGPRDGVPARLSSHPRPDERTPRLGRRRDVRPPCQLPRGDRPAGGRRPAPGGLARRDHGAGPCHSRPGRRGVPRVGPAEGGAASIRVDPHGRWAAEGAPHRSAPGDPQDRRETPRRVLRQAARDRGGDAPRRRAGRDDPRRGRATRGPPRGAADGRGEGALRKNSKSGIPDASIPGTPTADGTVDLLAFADWVSAGQKGRTTAESAEEKTYVAFLIDREEFGLPVESVREILRVGEVTRVPQAPPHIRGVTNVRGSILPVVEIRTRIGLEPLDPGPHARIVVLEVGERALGLLVDRVTRVAKVRVTEIEPPPAEIVTTRTDYVVGVAKGPEGLLILLDPARTLVVRA